MDVKDLQDYDIARRVGSVEHTIDRWRDTHHDLYADVAAGVDPIVDVADADEPSEAPQWYRWRTLVTRASGEQYLLGDVRYDDEAQVIHHLGLAVGSWSESYEFDHAKYFVRYRSIDDMLARVWSAPYQWVDDYEYRSGVCSIQAWGWLPDTPDYVADWQVRFYAV